MSMRANALAETSMSDLSMPLLLQNQFASSVMMCHWPSGPRQVTPLTGRDCPSKVFMAV